MKIIDVLDKEEYLIRDDIKKNNNINKKSMNKKEIDSLKIKPKEFLSKLTKQELVNLIQKLNYSYYIEGKSLVSDDLYDYVKEVLRKIDSKHTILDDVGVSKVYKTKLPYYMGSMDKIKTDEKTLKNWLKKYNGNGYTLSDKLDGISALYVIDDDNNRKLYTRGDGQTGKDISYLVNFIKGLSDKLNQNSLAVRGELIISKSKFSKIKVEGKVMNVRNIVSGIINSKKPNLDITKFIEFISYEVIIPTNLNSKEQFKYLEVNKFKNAYYEYKKKINIKVLSDFLENRRENSKYDIDGIIVTDNNLYKRNTDGNPKYSFAFKNILTLSRVEVMVLMIEWNITKDRYIQPVVTFSGVEIDGVIVKRATGKNAKFIKDNNIGPGSKIVVVRRGDVIPHIEKILSDSETGKPQMPEYKYIWNETGVEIISETDNKDLLKESNIKNIENFVNKMEFKGISVGIVKQMYEADINTITKFVNITKEELLKVDRIKEKKANNIVESIENTLKDLDCLKLMMASNTFGRGFAIKKIKLIMDNIDDKEFKNKPKVEDLIKIKGIEKKTAEKFIKNIDNYLIFLEETNIKCNFEKKIEKENSEDLEKSDNSTKTKSKVTSTFENMNVVFTGVRDKELEKKIEKGGGNMKTGVTKSVDYLIVKDKDSKSSKVEKAKELKIKIITLEEFTKKYL
jgi:DNA ligase (NAD+)